MRMVKLIFIIFSFYNKIEFVTLYLWVVVMANEKKYKGYFIEEIRFLPMGKKIFATYDEVSEFILCTLPKRGGLYYYKKQRMKWDSNILVLFQYDGHLIGSAGLQATIDNPTRLGSETFSICTTISFIIMGNYCIQQQIAKK